MAVVILQNHGPDIPESQTGRVSDPSYAAIRGGRKCSQAPGSGLPARARSWQRFGAAPANPNRMGGGLKHEITLPTLIV